MSGERSRLDEAARWIGGHIAPKRAAFYAAHGDGAAMLLDGLRSHRLVRDDGDRLLLTDEANSRMYRQHIERDKGD